jgi:aminodeoxyfutalosine synthase
METTQELILQSTQISIELKNIAKKVFSGERISFDEGVYLYEHANLSYLGTLANYVREKKNKNFVFFPVPLIILFSTSINVSVILFT